MSHLNATLFVESCENLRDTHDATNVDGCAMKMDAEFVAYYGHTQDQVWDKLQDVRSTRVFQVKPDAPSMSLFSSSPKDCEAISKVSIKKKPTGIEKMKKEVEQISEVSGPVRETLIKLIHQKKCSLKAAAKLLRVRYSAAKAIMRLFEQENELMDKVLIGEGEQAPELVQRQPMATVVQTKLPPLKIPNDAQPGVPKQCNVVSHPYVSAPVGNVFVTYQITNVTTTQETYTILPNNQVLFNTNVETRQQVDTYQMPF